MALTNPIEARLAVESGYISEAWAPWIGAITLLEMIKLHVSYYFGLGELLGKLDVLRSRPFSPEELRSNLPQDIKDDFVTHKLLPALSHCQAAGLTTTMEALLDMQRALPSITVGEFHRKLST